MWGLTRRTNSYVMKRRNVRQTLSTEPLNLSGVHSKANSGICNRTAIGVTVESAQGKSRQKDSKGKPSTRRVLKLVVKGKKGVSRQSVTAGAKHLVKAIKNIKGLTAHQRAQGFRKAAKVSQLR